MSLYSNISGNPYNPVNMNRLSLSNPINAETYDYDINYPSKRKYITALLPEECRFNHYTGFEAEISNCSIAVLETLCVFLHNIFSTKDRISNSERYAIIRCLLDKVHLNDWKELIDQVCFIMPIGTIGKYVTWATEVLSEVRSCYRKEVVNVANRLFSYNTLMCERGYILEAVSKLKPEELSNLDKADIQTRNEFIEEHVPSSLKEGARIVHAYIPGIDKTYLRLR